MAEVRRRLMVQAERQGQPSSARRSSARAQSRRTDDRVRPALCDLQARQSCSSRTSSSYPRQRFLTAAVQLIFAAAPPLDGRGQNGPPGSRRARARSEIRRQDRLHRGLRHQRRPRPVQGVDVWLNNRATSARGVRRQWSEGRAQRCPEPVRARWVVGRSLRRAERVAIGVGVTRIPPGRSR